MHRGLSDQLKAAFSDITSIVRPLVQNPIILNPQWVVGFVSGEGSFLIQIFKAKTKSGEATKLIFTITQHVRDQQLMESLITYLDCGNLARGRDAVDIRVTKFSDIKDKIITFFIKYPIIGNKLKDFQYFSKVAQLIENKSHLTKEGFDQIRNIKAEQESFKLTS